MTSQTASNKSFFSGNFKDIRPVGNRISTGPAVATVPLMQQIDQMVAAVMPAIRTTAR